MALEMLRAGVGLDPFRDYETTRELSETLSLIARHAKTARRLASIMCGDGVHSGEWVNANWEWLEKRDAQVEARLSSLFSRLPANVRAKMDGDPRYIMLRLYVEDETGTVRTVVVD